VSNRALFRPLLAIIFPRIFLIGFNFAQPFLITSVLNFLIDPPSTSAESQAYGLIAATGLIYMGIAVCIHSGFDKTRPDGIDVNRAFSACLISIYDDVQRCYDYRHFQQNTFLKM